MEHIRHSVDVLAKLCRDGRAVVHPDVFGEALIGCGVDRDEIVAEMRLIPMLDRLQQRQLEELVENNGIACKRIGWVDAGILCSAIVNGAGTTVLTFDKRLLREALRLGVAFSG